MICLSVPLSVRGFQQGNHNAGPPSCQMGVYMSVPGNVVRLVRPRLPR